MYQALYRKWRPKLFSDVVGQEQITKTLQNEIKSGRIGHAYLFIGSRGTGKTTCAKIFAKAVNCQNNNEGNPCCECEICSDIDKNGLMDIVEMDAASNNGVNDIRSICESSMFTPAKATYRVYIIDEVHMLSPGAFNALLKTLEEPPSHVIFILATTEVHKVPATILSRCQKFEFRKIPIDDILSRINYIAKAENITLEDAAALSIANAADGAMRDALTILDKCIALDKNVTLKKVQETIGLVGQEYLFKISQAILSNKPEEALLLVDELSRNSKDSVRLCNELIGFFRNLMIIKSTKDAQKLIAIQDEEFKNLMNLSTKVRLTQIINIMSTLESTLDKMSRAINAKIELEIALVKLSSVQLNTDVNSLISRIEVLERTVKALNVGEKSDTQNQDTKKPEVAIKKAKTESSAVKGTVTAPLISEESNENDLQKDAELMKNWQDVLNILKGYSQTIATAFKGSKAYISGPYVLIDAPKEMAFELLRKSSQRDKMRLAIKEVTGKSYKLGPYKKDDVKQENDPLEELAKIAKDFGVKVTKE